MARLNDWPRSHSSWLVCLTSRIHQHTKKERKKRKGKHLISTEMTKKRCLKNFEDKHATWCESIGWILKTLGSTFSQWDWCPLPSFNGDLSELGPPFGTMELLTCKAIRSTSGRAELAWLTESDDVILLRYVLAQLTELNLATMIRKKFKQTWFLG